MRHATITAVVLLLAQTVVAQTRMQPTAPGAPGDPKWQAFIRTSDGRTFVTDGGFAIDAALAKPAALPEREVPGKVLETYFTAPHSEEYALRELTPAPTGRTFITPNGIPLNATYVNFLARVLPAPAVRLRLSGELKPVVIVAGGKAVAVLMPVKK